MTTINAEKGATLAAPGLLLSCFGNFCESQSGFDLRDPAGINIIIRSNPVQKLTLPDALLDYRNVCWIYTL